MKRTLVMVVLLVVGAQRADATCANPMWNGTASTELPLRGSLYVYDSSIGYSPHEQAVSWNGTPGTVTQTKVAEEVVRIDYAGADGSELIVNRVGYRLVSDYRAPTSAPRVVDYWHHVFSWTCSSSDSLNIEIDQPTAAIRARWTYAGTTTEWLIPSPGTASTSTIELGKINCGGTTLDPDQLRVGGHLELVALRFDGREVPIVGLPNVIKTSMMRTRGTGEDAFNPLIELRPKLAAEPESKTDPRVYAIALFVLWLGAVFAAHRRLV